jgi:hypothetical protein
MADFVANANRIVALGKRIYGLKIRMIDNLLQASASIDPTTLSDTNAVQDGYLTGFSLTQLSATQLALGRNDRLRISESVAAALS